jgi:hypothetical protein
MGAAEVSLCYDIQTVWLNPLSAIHGKPIALQAGIFLIECQTLHLTDSFAI